MTTKRYLKENNLQAIPFNKGIGIYVMEKQVYHQQLGLVLSVPPVSKGFTYQEENPVLQGEDEFLK